MKLEELTIIEQLSQFLDGTQAVIFKISTLKEERYQWLQHGLIRFDLTKPKGVLLGHGRRPREAGSFLKPQK